MAPIISEENVLLRIKISKFVASEDSVDEVVLSRLNNAIIELRNGTILSSFRFDELVTIVQQLKVFYSYKPKFKHYLFMNASNLIVLRKAEGVLRIVKIYRDVSNYDIADTCHSGIPHVIVHLANQVASIVTDCVNENVPSSKTYNQVHAFAPYIQKSVIRIKNAEKMLQEKTKMISKLSSVLAFNCNTDRILSTTDRIVFLKEGLASAFIGLAAKVNALSVGKPWLKTHLGSWIIGFPIVNISKKDLFDFEMFVSHHCLTVNKTLLFTKMNQTREIDLYRQSMKLLHEEFGVLVAVIKAPYLIPKTFVLTCVSRFENSLSNEPEQSFLGNLEFNTSELGENNHYKLFSPNLSAEDLMTIHAASESYDLSFKSILNTTELLNTVESLQPFVKIAELTFVNACSSGNFPSMLLMIDLNHNRIRVNANTENDFLLIAHKLTNTFKESITFQHPKSDPLETVDTILKEIRYIKGVIIHELISSDSISPPRTTISLEEVSRDIMLLEMDSAAAMNSFEMYSNFSSA